jgi:hypothetical protein
MNITYYEKNRERLIQNSKQYYYKNKEKQLNKSKEYYHKNRDEINEKNKQYYTHIYYPKNKEKIMNSRRICNRCFKPNPKNEKTIIEKGKFTIIL